MMEFHQRNGLNYVWVTRCDYCGDELRWSDGETVIYKKEHREVEGKIWTRDVCWECD